MTWVEGDGTSIGSGIYEGQATPLTEDAERRTSDALVEGCLAESERIPAFITIESPTSREKA